MQRRTIEDYLSDGKVCTYETTLSSTIDGAPRRRDERKKKKGRQRKLPREEERGRKKG